MKFLFDGDFDLLEFVLEEKLDEYNNIEIHEGPVTIKETIEDEIKEGVYTRVGRNETIELNEESFILREVIPIVANHKDYHVIGVSSGPERDDIHYFAVPCEWTPRFGTASEPANEEELEEEGP